MELAKLPPPNPASPATTSMTPNGVSALAYRAREGLRQAYLQVHLGQLDTEDQQCRATVDRLGAWTRNGLSKRETAQVEAHLDGCDRCRALAAELADVNGALRSIIAPLVLGGNVFGWTADEATSFAVLDAFVDAGGTMIDTADVYSAWVPGHRGGESESVIGAWLKRSGKRDRVQIAITSARPGALLGWIADLERAGILVDTLAVTNNGDQTVAVQMTLKARGI